MPEIRNFDDLFLKQEQIVFAMTNQEPTDHMPHIDFDLELAGDLRAMATLSYSFKEKTWCGIVRQSETEEGSFDFDSPATREQFDNLLRAVPQERMVHIQALQAHFDENGNFPEMGPRP